MKKEYRKPVSDLIFMETEDVITASGFNGNGNGNGNKPNKPGNGFGDNNHDHSGPPGQNKK